MSGIPTIDGGGSGSWSYPRPCRWPRRPRRSPPWWTRAWSGGSGCRTTPPSGSTSGSRPRGATACTCRSRTQPQYNLLEREFEGARRERAERYRLGVLPYYALASGFLWGKYRADAPAPATPRADRAAQYLDERGRRVLAALDEVAAAHGAAVASVALAWLRVQPTVVAPIASASRVDQVPALLASATLELAPDELAALTAAA